MKTNIYILIGLIVLGVSISSFGNSETIISWETMKALDYKTGYMPDSLKQLKGKIVEVSGFIVPLELDGFIDTVSEFLLVPNPRACIHVPPPPPNQMILIKMKEAIPLNMDYRGVAIQGYLYFTKTADGIHGYELAGISAKEANIEFEDPLMDLIEKDFMEVELNPEDDFQQVD